jgi:hypothetical protein
VIRRFQSRSCGRRPWPIRPGMAPYQCRLPHPDHCFPASPAQCGYARVSTIWSGCPRRRPPPDPHRACPRSLSCGLHCRSLWTTEGPSSRAPIPRCEKDLRPDDALIAKHPVGKLTRLACGQMGEGGAPLRGRSPGGFSALPGTARHIVPTQHPLAPPVTPSRCPAGRAGVRYWAGVSFGRAGVPCGAGVREYRGHRPSAVLGASLRDSERREHGPRVLLGASRRRPAQRGGGGSAAKGRRGAPCPSERTLALFASLHGCSAKHRERAPSGPRAAFLQEHWE